MIVDEAQDLYHAAADRFAPRSSRLADHPRRRRAGDPAVAYRRLEELQPYLPEDVTNARIEELRHAYRVPAEIMELALPLLDLIAPDMEPPLAYRQGGGGPAELVQVAEAERLEAAMREAATLAERGTGCLP